MDEELLHVLSTTDSVDSYEYAQQIGKDHQLVVGAVKRLESLGDVSLPVRTVAKRLVFRSLSFTGSAVGATSV